MIVTRVFVFVRNINYSLLLPFPSSSAYGMGTVPFADNLAPLVFIPRVISTEQSLYLEVVSGMSHLQSRRDFGYGGRRPRFTERELGLLCVSRALVPTMGRRFGASISGRLCAVEERCFSKVGLLDGCWPCSYRCGFVCVLTTS